MYHSNFEFHLPDWLMDFLPKFDTVYPAVEDRMRFVMEIARLNVVQGTGGPFAACIFDQRTNKLVAPGVNLVFHTNCSLLHAEIVAILLAHRVIGHYDLGARETTHYELVASTEPCSMCLGALIWSGVRQLACGARDEDARRIGFDEGPKLADWVQTLEIRGIKVLQDICRDEAKEILQRYYESGGIIYNSRRGSTL